MATDKPNRPLDEYRAKRDFAATPEPSGEATRDDARGPTFVVQEHDATRLHWDLRLEHDGVAASWALPNGIPPTPKENRLAVRTEDHPLEYLRFEGEIPKGQYGAGTMRIWDRGTFETVKWESRKVEVVLHGKRLRGRYGLFPIGRSDGERGDWLIHRMDPPEDPGWEPMPERIEPMLARAGELPATPERWSFEVKWDGIRVIAYARPGRLRLESRTGNDITESFPEVRAILRDLGMHEVVLDGEIVAFDAEGRPSFSTLQRRVHVTSPSAVRRLAASVPAVYAIFDLLYLDGHSLLPLVLRDRRALLERLALNGPAWRVPAVHPGDGAGLLASTAAQRLEGVVAKRLDSRYEPGARNGAWLKIKHTRRQELVIGGWMPGTGRRTDRIGALLMGYFDAGELHYAGRVGTGFSEQTLTQLGRSLAPLRASNSPFARDFKPPRGAQFVAPELVAEIEFTEWTPDGSMRAPSFKGLRDDKPATQVVREVPSDPPPPGTAASGAPEQLFDSVQALGDGALSVVIDGRELRVTNWDKVLFPEIGFTKGDLISYYVRAAPGVLPHVRDRALTLKRYPGGVDGEYFYEKQSPSHRPDWVPTAKIGGVDYTVVTERATLAWLGNLADLELHSSLSLASRPDRPTMLVFDLDPGPPAAIVECCEVALVLRGMFTALGLELHPKTSGSKGLQLYAPVGGEVSYAETKQFAKQVAELLEQRLPALVVARMTRRLRAGKVLIDWGQNDAHKTTVTAYSIRALARPGVSTPLSWEEVDACLRARDAELLTFSPEQVLQRLKERGDLFAPVLSAGQGLPRLT
jgi:bifunctional non-homologous end joining protein LigD